MQMKLIGNEVKYCEKHLMNKTVEGNPVKTVVILIKYFFLIKQYSIAQIEKEIKQFLVDVGVELEHEYLMGLIKSNATPKTTINQLEKIEITHTELNTIRELGQTEQQRKILFTLLCWYKIKVGLGYQADYTVKIDYTHLNAEAHVALTKAKREEILTYFLECGLVEFGMGQLAKKIKLNYVADGMVAMTVTEFDCLDVYYKWWKDDFKGRLVICKECGELFISSSKTCPPKYCEDCAKKINIQQTIERRKR
jgi:hypothetical protein